MSFRRLSRAFGRNSKDSPPENDTNIIEERSIDQARPMRVVVIGSGLSGIISSIRLRQRVSNLDLCIYDKNDDVGGTWLENRYPGCACGMLSLLLNLSTYLTLAQDIPAHTYQASFEPNKEWSQFYAGAPEIHRYWKRVVDKYGCMEYVKLSSQVIEAVWKEGEGKWHLKVVFTQTDMVQSILLMLDQVQNTASNAVHSDQCDILISATGSLNNWKWPSIPGLHDFKGKLMHSASWDENYDYTVCEQTISGAVTKEFAGKESRRHRKWVQRHSDRPWDVARRLAYRPLCPWQNMGLPDVCPP